ncbi:hypothetical protein OUZ56_010931 [Daphnia magna]|uniref:Uncharacterized protein n=1 Tax=Daphnia magna TaxID=35525 RepID=A0ABQ9YYT0_9CRUS|nr:hypothetical protein OUZ56_010931 [Daphnia magna]
METPVEGERNDVRVELIEAEPQEFIPPEYRLSSRRPAIISSGALYSRIGRPDKLDNGVVFCVYKEPSCHVEALLPPPPPACQPPTPTCQPATEAAPETSFSKPQRVILSGLERC